MVITHELTMDLHRRGVTPVVDAVQGDVYTREVKLTLTDNGAQFSPPAGVSASVAFRKPDGKKGWYDKLPDGTEATAISGNIVTAVLAPEMLTTYGQVDAAIVLRDADFNQLSTFGITVQVAKNPAAGITVSNDYYNYSTLAEINAAVDAALSSLQKEAENIAPPVVCEESGGTINVNDSADRLLRGLTLYGKTTQDGTPTPDAPVELVKAGASGSIVSTITDGTDSNVQTITAQTPNGLPGIPVASGGNYTDENGQQWICDEIDFARGVYVQRVRELDFATLSWKRTAYSNEVQKGYYAKVNGFYNSRENFFHTHYRWLGRGINSGSGANSLGASQSVFDTRTIGEIGFLTKDEGRDTFGVVVGINDGTPVGTLQLVCVEPIETPLTAEELAAFAALHGNKPNTMVYNDAGAGMKIAYVADTKLYIDKKFNELAAAIVNNA